MALRLLVSKLWVSPSPAAASRAFSSQRGIQCKQCGSRIAKDGANPKRIEYDLSELESSAWKHYMIRAVAIVAHCGISWFLVSAGVAYLEDEENFHSTYPFVSLAMKKVYAGVSPKKLPQQEKD